MAKEIVGSFKSKLSQGLPISKGIKKGNHVYVSGSVSINENGDFIGKGDICAQTQQTLQSVVNVVESAGGTIDDIVKVNIYLKSISDFDDMNRTYKEFFKNGSYPARTTIEVTLGKEEWLVEIEAVAILD